MKINVKKLSDLATTPTYAHDGDAALDLYAATNRTIAPGSRALIATDIAVEIPRGYFGMVTGRSGNTIKYGVVGQVGIIDSGYRGGIGVILYNTDSDSHVRPNHRHERDRHARRLRAQRTRIR